MASWNRQSASRDVVMQDVRDPGKSSSLPTMSSTTKDPITKLDEGQDEAVQARGANKKGKPNIPQGEVRQVPAPGRGRGEYSQRSDQWLRSDPWSGAAQSIPKSFAMHQQQLLSKYREEHVKPREVPKPTLPRERAPPTGSGPPWLAISDQSLL